MSSTQPCSCGTPGCAGCSADIAQLGVAPADRFAHAAIRDRMLAAIGQERALDGLTTRDPDDVTIALIDAWAGALHVLEFSAARLADDVDLAIGTDPSSLLELTRLIGYTPRPAIAAQTLMSFSVDPTATADPMVPLGTQIATVPHGNELPITFETSADLSASVTWNALLPMRTMVAQKVAKDTTKLTVVGTDVRASQGDGILAQIDDKTLLFARLANITRVPDPTTPHTDLALAGGVAFTRTGFGPADGEVAILGVRSSAFGALAPDYELFNKGADTDWPDLKMPDNGTVDLSSLVKEALPGALALFVAGTVMQAGSITTAIEASRAGFGLSGPVTRITPNGVNTKSGDKPTFNDKVRDTAIHIETQSLTLLQTPQPDEPFPHAATPDRITVLGTVTVSPGHQIALKSLSPGRQIALIGTDRATGAPTVVPATLVTCDVANGNTTLTLAQPIQTQLMAEGLTIAANVVSATAGATPPNPPELLGSSDSRVLAPTFVLSSQPVAYVPDTSVVGYHPAIEVRVGDRLYPRVERFLGLTDDRAWRLRQRRDGKFEVQFAGRLPTGTNNVTATYRVGGGASGNVDAGRVSMIMKPVLGVSSAGNLTAAEDGSDAAGPDDIRNAGDSVAMIERVVSLADYERFARNFRGVGKALATELREDLRRTVYLTIADTDGQQPSDTLVSDLASALAGAAIPGRKVRIIGFESTPVAVTVAFASDPALPRADVETAVRAALQNQFSPLARDFGQSLYASEIMAATQDVNGVIAATVTMAVASGPRVLFPPWFLEWRRPRRLPPIRMVVVDPAVALPPRIIDGQLALAGLVAISANGLTLAQMVS